MKKILLTGALGQLGRAMQAEGHDIDFVCTDMVESSGVSALDIASISAVRDAVNSTHPDCIVNCAGYTNVDGCEKDEDGAFLANAIGPKNLAIVSNEAKIPLVHISTDYVFDGAEREPIRETEKPDPVSAYGRTKLAGEEYVKDMTNQYYILRTAWLYGEGKNFVRTMLALSEKHDEVSVVCDQFGSPTSAVELARTILYLIGTGSYGIYHATCEGQTNWADFTEEIYKRRGIKTHVKHVTSAEYAIINPASANRPAYSVLDNYMLRMIGDYRMAHWEEALTEYLD